ncbi:MFS transporter [Acidithiobacillus sp. CV18-2]|nr:MFS transporter [Acidithiobacillus sp. CV18-3]MBU2756902.1 MFS transporter [Acidithiobacillus sp. BN09-2]MBU2778000.1 MFS transporter [Acidithiobacillus sp. CV18-2]MBU2799613.1 MFS transporter [Acidithiobacillus sp. VAN18-4]
MQKGIAAVFGAGFLQGSAFVLIPALGSILRSSPYDMSNSTYGLLYFPEIIGAVLAALAAGSIHKQLGAHGLFRVGVLANAIAMGLLVLAFFSAGSLVVWVLLAETLLLGIGFGLTNAAINRSSTLIFAGSATAAVTILNAVIGGATSISPMLLHLSVSWMSWVLWPAILLIAWLATLLLPQADEPEKSEIGGLAAWRRSMIPFALAVVVYAICEGSFGSWANILVSVDHHLPAATGAAALSLFWGGMTVARFALGSMPDQWLSRRWVYRAAPLGMAICFLIIPHLQSATSLLLFFALAGAACGIYYPYSMAFGVARHGKEGTQMAGLLVGALMVGEGIGSTALGPLQNWISLNQIYSFSALWAIPLLWLAWHNSRPVHAPGTAHG